MDNKQRKKFEKIINNVFDELFNETYQEQKWDIADWKNRVKEGNE